MDKIKKYNDWKLRSFFYQGKFQIKMTMYFVKNNKDTCSIKDFIHHFLIDAEYEDMIEIEHVQDRMDNTILCFKREKSKIGIICRDNYKEIIKEIIKLYKKQKIEPIWL